MNEIKPGSNQRLTLVVSFSVFLFFALMLSVPNGYVLGAVLLLLSSFYFLARRPVLSLSREDKTLAWLLLAIFLISVFIFFFHGNNLRTLDLPLRYLLTIPVLLLLLRVPPRLSWLWAGLVVGCVSAAGVAAWQLEWLGMPRALGFTGVIQFGDMGVMMGVFCAAGLFWSTTQARYARQWQAALMIGSLAGFYTSIASGSRGGWLATAPVLLLFGLAFLSRRNVKQAIGVLIVLCVGVVILATTVPSVETRYDVAVTEVQQYQEDRDADTSIGARLEMWRALAPMILQKSLLGWSVTDYRSELERLVAEKKARPIVLRLANTHNNYLELWVFQGLLGLLAVLVLFAVSFWYFFKRMRSKDVTVRALALCGAALLVSFLVFGMSQVILGRNNTLLFFLLALAVLWGSLHNQEEGDVKNETGVSGNR